MKPLWMKEILREAEDEGGGAGYVFEGDDTGDPAPETDDRNSRLERRIEEMGRTIEGFMKRSETQQRSQKQAAFESQMKAAEAKVARELDTAESELAEAFDTGDGAAVARAQRKVAEAAARKERVAVQIQQFRDQIKASERRKPETSQSGDDDLDTTNLDKWKSRNASWYGVDKDMTKAAHEIDARIREAGVIQSGTEEYFNAIDRQMKQKFPDRFSGSPPSSSSNGHGGSPSGGRQVRIPATVAEGYRRMGIDIDNPEVAKRMIANREKAVKKGWLPEQPVSGRILQR